MSRIGRTPIKLPENVEVKRDGQTMRVSGPKGELQFRLPLDIDTEIDEGELRVTRKTDTNKAKAKHGMARSVLHSMVIGVTDGFTRELEIQGVGMRGECSGQTVTLNLGYSHPVKFTVPESVSPSMPSNTRIVLQSCDKHAVGQVAADIRALRPPDAYKGKGIRYVGEEISLKEGKSVG